MDLFKILLNHVTSGHLLSVRSLFQTCAERKLCTCGGVVTLGPCDLSHPDHTVRPAPGWLKVEKGVGGRKREKSRDGNPCLQELLT